VLFEASNLAPMSLVGFFTCQLYMYVQIGNEKRVLNKQIRFRNVRVSDNYSEIGFDENGRTVKL
jgi:hypothetical protein